jgi:hypothetical protein
MHMPPPCRDTARQGERSDLATVFPELMPNFQWNARIDGVQSIATEGSLKPHRHPASSACRACDRSNKPNSPNPNRCESQFPEERSFLHPNSSSSASIITGMLHGTAIASTANTPSPTDSQSQRQPSTITVIATRLVAIAEAS